MEEPDDNSDLDDLFLPFALSRVLHNQGVQSSSVTANVETSGEYVEIVLDEDSNSSGAEAQVQACGSGQYMTNLGVLDVCDTTSPCPSPSALSPVNPSDSQQDLSDLSRANASFKQQHMLEKFDSFDSIETERDESEVRERKDSILDGLLCEIYDRCHTNIRPCVDSDGFTECSSDGAYLSSKGDSFQESSRLPKAILNAKSSSELRDMVRDLQHGTAVLSGRLIKQLKRRDRYLAKRQKNQDVLTAILQAVSQKRRVDAQLRFSIEPLPGKKAFRQWYDALRAVARLPFGLPRELRKAVWLSLADKHIKHLKLDWEKTVRVAFNDHSNPDDDKLGVQIVKDLHRTGCSGFCGQGAEEDRVVLKRVLLAYARWNKSVGYCQGFNVIAALILEVMERIEDDALKVMIFLIDHVLPDSYFANNLRALSVDMAVFRELLHFKLPELAQHLDKLQKSANDGLSGSYEPPLTNVFTMQWFLTLFATCLPKKLVLRVWDTLFLEGSEVLLRVALAIWAKLSQPLLEIKSADEFYSQMAVLCSEMLQNQLIDGDDLVQTIYSMASFPFPHLNEIREKYMFSITPFSPLGALEKSSAIDTKAPSSGSAKLKEGSRGYSQPAGSHSDEEVELFDEEDLTNMTCFTGLFPPTSPYRIQDGTERQESTGIAADDIAKISPGAYGTSSEDLSSLSAALMERMTMDVQSLKKQYLRIQRRQMRAHVIYGPSSMSGKRALKSLSDKKNPAVAIESPAAVNHLLLGKTSLGRKNAKFASTPQIAPPPKRVDEKETPIKRVHINTKPNVRQLALSQDKEVENVGVKEDEKQDQCERVISPVDGVTGQRPATEGEERSSVDDEREQGHQSPSSTNNGNSCSQESAEPVVGTLIDLDDGNSRFGCHTTHGSETSECNGLGAKHSSSLGDVSVSREDSTSGSAQDLNANKVPGDLPDHPEGEKGVSAPRSPRAGGITGSRSIPDFNCAVETFKPSIPRSSLRRYSEASEPTSLNDKKPWMEPNGSVGSKDSVSADLPQSFASRRRQSSSSSSCEEPVSPLDRVVFNPFPKRALHSSMNRTRTRMKLGLYPGHNKDAKLDSSTKDGRAEQLSQDFKRTIKLSS
ncbi:TBC1 domain family member 30-like [Diadema antillarum]|uniref:TBC1 domain family member 30-like n=2 Tax=Diadema antillarum TaxID=105358 RepID=UPI003A8AB83E